MKSTFVVAVGLVAAAASYASTQNGAIIMSNDREAGAAQSDNQSFMMRPLRFPATPPVDALRLVEKGGQPTLLYSTRAGSDPGPYELVIHAAPVADVSRTTEVARVSQSLPPPSWDARPVGDQYEIVYEQAGGAVGAILFQDIQGNTKRVSVEHPFQSFSRPHFVRGWTHAGTPDVAAVADLKKVVVFPGGTKQPVKYLALADGADGIVGGTTDRWVAAKSMMSGDALFGTLPGRLTLSRVGAGGARTATVPDFLAYELDAAPLGNDVVVFATSRPALLILGQRPERPYRLSAEDRSWLLRLSRPTILVTAQAVHIAALVSPGSDQAFVLYGTVPIGALAGQ
jgi:hypothetical protein